MTLADMKVRIAVLQEKYDAVVKQEAEVIREAVYAKLVPEGVNDPVKVIEHLQARLNAAVDELQALDAEINSMGAEIMALLNDLDTAEG